MSDEQILECAFAIINLAKHSALSTEDIWWSIVKANQDAMSTMCGWEEIYDKIEELNEKTNP